MPLSRDSLSDDSFKQKMLDEAPGEMTLMEEGAFEASRRAILDKAEETGELWVFGYGSLIWNPIVQVAERRLAHLPGHARRFCVWRPSDAARPIVPACGWRWMKGVRGATAWPCACPKANGKRRRRSSGGAR